MLGAPLLKHTAERHLFARDTIHMLTCPVAFSMASVNGFAYWATVVTSSAIALLMP